MSDLFPSVAANSVRPLLLLIASFSILLLVISPLQSAEPVWKVGYAQRNLVPEDIDSKTYYMAGYSSDKPVQGVHDPIWVRCISLDSGTGTKVILASLDVVGLPYTRVLSIRKKLEDWMQENNVSLQIFSTHTHASIDTIGIWGPTGQSGCDQTWMNFLEKAVVDAAQEALANAVPGQLTFGQIMASGMVIDKSPPQVPNEQISVFRFEPTEKNVKPIWLMHFSSHPESLEDKNRSLSSDFVHATREMIEQTKNCHAMYINGAIGSMQTVPELHDSNGVKTCSHEAVCEFGRDLGKIALKIEDWENVEPALLLKTQTTTIPVYNNVFILAQRLKLVDERIAGGEYECDPRMLVITRKPPRTRKLPTMLIEVGYLKVGKDIGIVFIPGELAPELASGAYLPPERCNNPELTPERPLFEIMPDKFKLVFGLANDEIGYILPRNDYYISPTQPWIPDVDKFGYRHYPETNGTGPETANVIAETLEVLVK
ncbi:MAG: hypothetical protein ACRC10_05395 [Thermoguttaceae bacterium]